MELHALVQCIHLGFGDIMLREQQLQLAPVKVSGYMDDTGPRFIPLTCINQLWFCLDNSSSSQYHAQKAG